MAAITAAVPVYCVAAHLAVYKDNGMLTAQTSW